VSPRRRVTPILDQLGLAERGDVLGQLLAIHPELLGDAEELARDQLKVEDADSVAEEFEEALRGVDADQLASRAGRVRGRGYVHVNEAACELLAEELEPYLKDLARRAALGLAEAAQAIGLGLLRGLAECDSDVEEGSVLGYAGPDAPGELAWSVCRTLKDAGVILPADSFEDLPEGWARLV
jgi:hypothetical protein